VDEVNLWTADRMIFRYLQSIYQRKKGILISQARKEHTDFSKIFLKNTKMLDEAYSDDNAAEYACM
jgi:hypothetical protein